MKRTIKAIGVGVDLVALELDNSKQRVYNMRKRDDVAAFGRVVEACGMTRLNDLGQLVGCEFEETDT